MCSQLVGGSRGRVGTIRGMAPPCYRSTHWRFNSSGFLLSQLGAEIPERQAVALVVAGNAKMLRPLPEGSFPP